MGAGLVPSRAMTAKQRPDRNLALDLVRVTEAAALAAGSRIARLDYPRDYAQLPQVRQAILDHATDPDTK